MLLLRYIFIIFIPFLFFSCKSLSIADADAFFDRGEYAEAQKKYREIYRKLDNRTQRTEKGEVAYKLGLSYLNINQYKQAEGAFLNAQRFGIKDNELNLNLADCYFKQGNLNEAQFYLDKYFDNDSISNNNITLSKSLNYAFTHKQPSRYKIREVPFITGRRSNYAPAFAAGDYDKFYFTSTEEYSAGDTKSLITGTKNGDIWLTEKNERGEWTRPMPILAPMNTEQDEGVITFSPDGLTMYYTRSSKEKDKDSNVEIWFSERRNGEWDEPQPLEILNDSVKYNIAHPSVSPDGQYLYFTSDMPGGYGGYDIWRINLFDENYHSQNLGPRINTTGDEIFPYAANDSTLFFSSNTHPGFGGLDIFKASLDNSFNWKVENIGLPLNSSADDFGIVLLDENSGYLSSNRGDFRGSDHIYEFNLPSTVTKVTGFVMDTEEYAVPDAVIRVIGDDGAIAMERTHTNGYFSINLLPGRKYLIQASAQGFLNTNTSFTTQETEEDAEYNVDFVLVPVNKPVVIDDIYYDFDSASLREESKTSLDSLVNMLNNYPDIRIKLNSHTDRVGTESYNLDLSRRRALSVVDYLVHEGKIDPKRLTYQGYGKTKPFVITPRIERLYPQFEQGIELNQNYVESLEDENDREIADQINRRTEFEIINNDYLLF